ncbi:hypothetical protein D3C87_1215980 [compost metagenome]
MRAVASDTPPGENGTTYLIGLLGQVSARTPGAAMTSESPPIARAARNAQRFTNLMSCLQFL